MSQVYTEQTAMEMLYRDRQLQGVPFDTQLVEQYNSVCDELELAAIDADANYSTDFDIPVHYQQLDVADYIWQLADTGNPEVVRRVEQELEIYRARNLFPVLQTLIYIVDTMRKNNIVWGVGRGSSVASYCLYLLDIHRIDSIRYGLDIKEFFK